MGKGDAKVSGLLSGPDAGWRRGGRRRTVLEFKQPSRAKQEFAAECDINTIMAKYQKTGVVSHVARFQGNYEDVTGAVDYQTAHNIVLQAQDAFMSLPSSMRARFENDPGAFLAFVNDPANKEKLYDLGLAVRPKDADLADDRARGGGGTEGPPAAEKPAATAK